MNRLVVNPGTPQAWEIQLKQGTNLLGRGFTNDFKIDDPSVSGSHCQITVTDGSALIKDLGSTNGTFINSAPIQEAKLEPGQIIKVGGVEMVFHSDAPQTVALSASEPPPPLPTVTLASPPLPPPLEGAGTTVVQAGPRFCKFHPKSPARFLCKKCNRTFCDLCVTSRNVGGVMKKTCRTCGVECVPLQAQAVRPTVNRGFFGRLPGVFLYPFRGSGLLILIVGTLVFAGLQIMSAGWMSILMKMLALGYLFSYMQNIIHSTAAEDEEMPSLPGTDELFGAFFRLAGTVVMAFGLAIGLIVASFFEVEIPAFAIIAAVIFGCLYFPMAFLAVAMKDNVAASNPLVVVPAILKVPLEYLVTVILLTSVFGIQRIGDLIASGARQTSFMTRDMTVLFITFGIRAGWSLISVYLLTVNMRILGLLYLTKKHKFGWFSH